MELSGAMVQGAFRCDQGAISPLSYGNLGP